MSKCIVGSLRFANVPRGFVPAMEYAWTTASWALEETAAMLVGCLTVVHSGAGLLGTNKNFDQYQPQYGQYGQYQPQYGQGGCVLSVSELD